VQVFFLRVFRQELILGKHVPPRRAPGSFAPQTKNSSSSSSQTAVAARATRQNDQVKWMLTDSAGFVAAVGQAELSRKLIIRPR